MASICGRRGSLGRPDGEREADVTVGDRLLHGEEEVGRVAGVDRSGVGRERGPTGADFYRSDIF